MNRTTRKTGTDTFSPAILPLWGAIVRRGKRLSVPGFPAVAALLLVTSLAANAQTPVSYEFFRDNVQPIFLKKRPGHARCVECHDNQTPRLQPLDPGATTWNEEQSRKNYDA